MNTDRSEMTEKILYLTLEIIRLVTGEDYVVVKKVAGHGVDGSNPSLLVPPYKFQETDNDLKIMDLANMIIQLLSEEVSSKFNILRVQLPAEDGKDPLSAAGSSDRPETEGDSNLQHTQDCVKEETTNTQDFQVMALLGAPALNCADQRFGDGYPSQTLQMERGGQILSVQCKEEDIPAEINQGLFVSCEVKHEGHECFTSSHNYGRANTFDTLEALGENLRAVHLQCDLQRNPEILLSNDSRKEFHCTDPAEQDRNTDLPFARVKFTRTDATGKMHRCRQCRINFTNTLAFRAHQQAHRSAHRRARQHILNYICSDCGKGFHQITHLVRHKRMHTGEKPFVCSECGSAFSQSSNLLAHEKTHSGERPFTCPDCGKCFTKKQTLVRHQIIHTGERPFSCSECHKNFSARSVLVRHQQVHRGEKPFACPYCNRRFSRNSNLLRHQTIHTREKP